MENKEKINQTSRKFLCCRDCVYYVARGCRWHNCLVVSDFVPCEFFILNDVEEQSHE